MFNPYFTDEMKDAYSKHMAYVDNALKQILLEYAEPKIKGEITKGKIKWRGIKLCQQQFTGLIWIEQRGKVLGHKMNRTVKIEFR